MPQFKTLELCFPYSLTQHTQFVSKSFWLELLAPSNTAICITTVIPSLALLFLATSPTPSLVSHNSQSGPLETWSDHNHSSAQN